MTNSRLATAVNCLLVSVDRRLCKRGYPMYNNIEAVDRLLALGFEMQNSISRVGRGETLRVRYYHPQLGVTVYYIEEELADTRTWCLERAA